MTVLVTPRFARDIKGLHPTDKKALNAHVHALVAQPDAGEMKKGDLAGVRVVKYRHNAQQWLLVYEVKADVIALIAHGSHENFYRDLKR